MAASMYLTRFVRSRAGHGAPPRLRRSPPRRQVRERSVRPPTAQVFPICSHQSIQPSELAALEVPFLRAIDHRLYVTDGEFQRFCGYLERGPPAAGGSCGGRKRKAAAASGAEEPRSVRACRPPVVAS